MIFLGGTSGFHYGQVVLQIHLSVGQVDFLTKFDPWYPFSLWSDSCFLSQMVGLSYIIWNHGSQSQQSPRIVYPNSFACKYLITDKIQLHKGCTQLDTVSCLHTLHTPCLSPALYHYSLQPVWGYNGKQLYPHGLVYPHSQWTTTR